MRVGLMMPPHVDPREASLYARRAEEYGFDYLCCGEHVFFHVPMPNAFVVLAAAAGATSRIRLLSALTILPMYPAALAAKLAATLDQVSGGRLELGVGVGGEFPPEFEAVGVPVTERGLRTDEALELLAALFAGESVTFEGRFSTVRGLTLAPPPVQSGGPPVWVGGRKEASIRRTARFGDVWMPYLAEPSHLARGLVAVREQAAALGRDGETIEGSLLAWSAVDRDAVRARRQVVSAVGATYQQDFEPLADRLLVFGSPAQVVDRLGEYEAAGASRLVFGPACAPEETEAMVELFAAEVLPQLQAR